MGNLSSYGTSEYRQGGISPPPSAASPQEEQPDVCEDTAVEGYASDDLVHTNSSSRERKKGKLAFAFFCHLIWILLFFKDLV